MSPLRGWIAGQEDEPEPRCTKRIAVWKAFSAEGFSNWGIESLKTKDEEFSTKDTKGAMSS
jgi:hypothetical protein